MEQLSSEISSVHTAISHLNHAAMVKQEQLERLQRCESQLAPLEDDLQNYSRLIKKPELHSENWMGSNAQEFEGIREESMVTPFNELINIQYSQLKDSLSNKISELKSEIQSLQSQVSSQRARLSQLESQSKELAANG
ncbi:YwqH-like family protein [Fictibacillus phosphorivorans]|uniref:YwqH-like family protein n=1 Tax=Fictibacillus phosphorivorans TaxID=1221500 RepID=UPI001D178A33|nr:DUF5082 family protein [Fictibacillus phosphorivorans]